MAASSRRARTRLARRRRRSLCAAGAAAVRAAVELLLLTGQRSEGVSPPSSDRSARRSAGLTCSRLRPRKSVLRVERVWRGHCRALTCSSSVACVSNRACFSRLRRRCALRRFSVATAMLIEIAGRRIDQRRDRAIAPSVAATNGAASRSAPAPQGGLRLQPTPRLKVDRGIGGLPGTPPTCR